MAENSNEFVFQYDAPEDIAQRLRDYQYQTLDIKKFKDYVKVELAKKNGDIGQDFNAQALTVKNNVTVSGNMGIGTAPTGERLEIKGSLRVSGNITGTGGMTILDRLQINDSLSVTGNITGKGVLTALKGANIQGSLSVSSNITASGELIASGGLKIDGNRSTHLEVDGSLYRLGGQLYLTVDDNLYIRDAKGGIKMHFDTNNSRLGIGMTNPSYPLHVKQQIANNWQARFTNATANVYLSHSGGHGLHINTGQNNNSGRYGLQVRNAQSTHFYVRDDGNVGIGQTKPSTKLDVNGTAQVTGLKVNGNTWFRPTDTIYVNYGSWAAANEKFITFETNYADDSNRGLVHFYAPTNYYTNIPALTLAGNYGKGGNVGIGTTNPSHTLHTNGTSYAKTRAGGGIDYAEYFESASGEEIPTGLSVVIENGKIRPAKNGEIPIGIISANPGIVGGLHAEWPKRYLSDELGRILKDKTEAEIMIPKKIKVTKERQKMEMKTVEEEVTNTEVVKGSNGRYIQKEITEKVTRQIEEPVFKEVDLYDASGKEIIGTHMVPVMETYEEVEVVLDESGNPVLEGTGQFVTEEIPRLNPNYDPSAKYISRTDRPEWNCVGLLGQIPLTKGLPVASSWVKIKDISESVELWLVK